MIPALETHRALLERWRDAMDLVGPGPVEPHFEDAIRAVGGFEYRGEWADLGSGAGFPGVALAALHPNANVLLVERREKRAVFLEEVVAAVGLANLRVFHGDSAALPRASLDGVISRAYRPPAEMIEEARRLLRPRGLLVLLLAAAPPPVAADFPVFHVERYTVDHKERSAVALRYGI